MTNFENWLRALHQDASRTGFQFAVSRVSHFALYLFWKDGFEPTIQGLMGEAPLRSSAKPCEPCWEVEKLRPALHEFWPEMAY